MDKLNILVGFILLTLYHIISAIAVPTLSEECVDFDKYPAHALYGFNNHIVNDVYLDECKLLCVTQTHFFCVSLEYNEKAGSCYLSAESQYTQPSEFDANQNTDYYQRVCANISADSSSSAGPEGAGSMSATESTTTRATTTSHRPVSSTETTTPSPSTEIMEVKPQFHGQSYIEVIGVNHINRLTILTMEFHPYSDEGLLLYQGESTDFISLSLTGGYVEFRFDLADGPAIIRSANPIEINKTHMITATRMNKMGKLKVDDNTDVMGESPGELRELNLEGNVFLGFVPDSLKSITAERTEMQTGYVGCIESLTIDGLGARLTYDLSPTSEDEMDAVAVSVCGDDDVQLNECDLKPCSHGKCIPEQPQGYHCECPPEYTGSQCKEYRVVDVLDFVELDKDNVQMIWINCIGRLSLTLTNWSIAWYQNDTNVSDFETRSPQDNFVHTQYTADLLGSERLFVAQLYFPHLTDNRVYLNGNYTCEIIIPGESSVKKSLEVIT